MTCARVKKIDDYRNISLNETSTPLYNNAVLFILIKENKELKRYTFRIKALEHSVSPNL